MTKLWQKDKVALKEVEKFTVGKDRELDMHLAKFDVLGSLAHTRMLASVGLLTQQELSLVQAELKNIYAMIEAGQFVLEEVEDDVHSQLKFLLNPKLGERGKKIHSARDRNDQVLVDLKMFLRSEIEEVPVAVKNLFDLLLKQSEK